MLALITGAGRLPVILREKLEQDGRAFLWCSLDPDDGAEITVSLGTLGGLIEALKTRGVERICLAGSVNRRDLQIGDLDNATEMLVPKLQQAMALGDDGALKIVLSIFEEAGLPVVGAHEICPELLPAPGFLGAHRPGDQDLADCARAGEVLRHTGAVDIGQGCVVAHGQVLAVEALPGTDHMLFCLSQYRNAGETGGVLMKAPKPGQDRRADLPAIGPDTVTAAASAGLSGIAVEAGGVMVLEPGEVARRAKRAGLFVWVREPDN